MGQYERHHVKNGVCVIVISLIGNHHQARHAKPRDQPLASQFRCS